MPLPVDYSDQQPQNQHLPEQPQPSTVGSVVDRLLGRNGQDRYQTWPERLVRDALSAPHDALTEGTLPPGLRREDYTDKPVPGGLTAANSPADKLISQALNVSAMAGTGGLAGAEAGAGEAALGSGPFLRPALKYNGKLYKAPMGGQHLDAIPADIYPEFQRQAMNGEDISNFNFGFMNHKGQFLDREKAMDYAVKEGLLDPRDASQGALTSTVLNADNQAGFATKALEEAGHLASPEKAKFRLGQMLRDKAATKKAGDDVESSDYMHYNSQIRALRGYLKGKQ
jgi:hypothetical protein